MDEDKKTSSNESKPINIMDLPISDVVLYDDIARERRLLDGVYAAYGRKDDKKRIPEWMLPAR